MSRRRRNTSSSEESEDLPPPKRARALSIHETDLEYEPTTHEKPRVHATYGQQGCFPGLGDDKGDDELFYGPASNGLEYLRMVRSEAKGLPDVFRAANGSNGHERNGHIGEDEVDEHGFEESAFFYGDEAFIATPDPAAQINLSTNGLLDAQDAYYESLIYRFKQLRKRLHQSPPLSAIETLTSSHPISLPPESERARQQWRAMLVSQEPQMVQLGCMDMETLLELVKLLKSLLANTVRGRSQKRIHNFGAWIWAVLAKCNDIGQLGSEEVSELRELGKRAVGLLVGIRDKSGAAYGRESEDEAEDREEAEEGEITDKSDSGDGAEDLAKAKARLRDQLVSQENVLPSGPVDSTTTAKLGPDSGGIVVNQQIRMMLDTVITVVGDCYGQRDLLEFRDVWDEDSTGIAEEVEA